MALRRQIIQKPPSNMEDSNASYMRSAQFTNIYLATYFLGGITTFRMNETNGNTFVNNIGNDWLELRPGMRQFAVSFSRNQIRGKTFRDMMGEVYTTADDIDGRALPVDMRIHQCFQSVSGGKTFEDTWITVRTAFFTNIDDEIPDPTALRSESVSFIAKGCDFSGTGVRSYGVQRYLLGSSDDIARFDSNAQYTSADNRQ